jgi:predicted patatin/cPLA2 family phospholipase
VYKTGREGIMVFNVDNMPSNREIISKLTSKELEKLIQLTKNYVLLYEKYKSIVKSSNNSEEIELAYDKSIVSSNKIESYLKEIEIDKI